MNFIFTLGGLIAKSLVALREISIGVNRILLEKTVSQFRHNLLDKTYLIKNIKMEY